MRIAVVDELSGHAHCGVRLVGVDTARLLMSA